MNKHTLRLLIAAFCIAVIGVLYYQGIFNYLTIDFFKDHLTFIKQHIEAHYALSVAIFIMGLATIVAFSVPLGIATPLVSGLLFGIVPGTLYAIIGVTLGALAAFLLSRYLVGGLFQERFGTRLAAFNQELEKYGFIYLLGLHFFPITPFFILNLLAGLTNIPLWTFLWTTVVGVFPAYAIYAYIGQQLSSISELKDLLSGKIALAFVLLKILSLVTVVLGRFLHRPKN